MRNSAQSGFRPRAVRGTLGRMMIGFGWNGSLSRWAFALSSLGVLASACAPDDEAVPLSLRAANPDAFNDTADRSPLAKRSLALPADPSVKINLVVKFTDAAEVRPRAGGLYSRTGVAIDEVDTVATEYGLQFEPMITLADARVESLLDRARTRSHRAQPDLLGLHRVVGAASRDDLLAAGQDLAHLDAVEFAYFEHVRPPNPATDIDPMTPDLVSNQGYRGAENGIDMEGAAVMGLDGSGVRISDVEYNWNADHEAWNDGTFTQEAGTTIPPDLEFNGDHGTAVAGELVAHGAGYGVTGITPASPFFVYPQATEEAGYRRTEAVTSALADSGVGDVVLLEIQTSENLTGQLAPGEIEEAIWMATRVGTDAGVVVVAAAGNGNLDLDREELAYYRERGDSGAIIVGAGAPLTRARLTFSTYGERVDVQGWGQQVFTTGYGQFAAYGGDRNQEYTAIFSGTSSASPIVTGAAVLLQQAAIEAGSPLTSTQMRAVLVGSGLPQGTGGKIGPLPQVGAALSGGLQPETNPPVVTFSMPASDVAVEETSYVTDLNVEVDDDSVIVTSVRLSIAGEELPVVDVEAPFSFADVTFPEGTWEVVATAVDLWGNVGESQPLTIAVGVEIPPESTGMAASTSGAGSTSEGPDAGTAADGTTSTGAEVPPVEDEGPVDDDGTSESGDTDPGANTGDDGDCACRSGDTAPGWTLLGIFVLLGVGRRRVSPRTASRTASRRPDSPPGQ